MPPIGVFDSGVGGLTVLRALLEALPGERFLYLGDTARLPYGTRSEGTVVRYALQATELLLAHEVKALIVACNTASAVALPALRERCGALPVLGVVEPGAQAAAAVSRSGRIAVIGTEATVRGGAYARAIATVRPGARVLSLACQLFVALAEEGWTDGPVARAAAERYLGPWFPRHTPQTVDEPDTLVLGCTHFPMLMPAIRAIIGERIAIVDSAATAASAAGALLREGGSLGAVAAPGSRVHYMATDGAARFARVGSRFLGCPIEAAAVQIVDL